MFIEAEQISVNIIPKKNIKEMKYLCFSKSDKLKFWSVKMRIEIEIPKEFEEHFNQDKFKDSFKRIMADIEHFQHSSKNGYWLCAGRYELETIEMLQKAFKNSKQAYDVDKVVDELKEAKHEICLSDDDLEHYRDGVNRAIEIVEGGIKQKNLDN